MSKDKFTHHGFAVKQPKIPGAPICIKVYDNRQEAIMDNILIIDNEYELIRGYDLRQLLYKFIATGQSILTFKQTPSEQLKKAAKILKKKFFVSFSGENTGKRNAITITELREYVKVHIDEFFPPEPEETEETEVTEDTEETEDPEENEDDDNDIHD